MLSLLNLLKRSLVAYSLESSLKYATLSGDSSKYSFAKLCKGSDRFELALEFSDG